MESVKTILVCGGTTEGRVALQTLSQADGRVLYSTRSAFQQVGGADVVRCSGALDAADMARLCLRENVGLIVDAGHPFAVGLHESVVAAAKSVAIPAVRLERFFPPLSDEMVMCDDYAHACLQLFLHNPEKLLVLTGVQTISRLLPFTASRPDTIYRVLDRDSSRELAARSGIDPSRLVYYSLDEDSSETPEAVEALIRAVGADAVITKESGRSGGFEAKALGARAAGAKLFVVRHPALPAGYAAVVEGPAGLRRAVEKLLPGFFTLRSGLTTGTCAVAATRAALFALEGENPREVLVPLPGSDERIAVSVESVRRLSPSVAEGVVIKDAGDDPDVTHNASVVVRLSVSRSLGPVTFLRGEGIGVVTLPGTGLQIGEPAINPVPREMITRVIRESIPRAAVDVTVSIPGGVELALKTFNSRIGIEGGLSVIGTTGIVRPFSHEAFIEAIRREFQVAVSSGVPRIVINSGGRSERVLRTLFPDLPHQAFIHYGNAIGETLKIATDLYVPALTIGLMIGKAVKLAEGRFDTHSHKVTMNRDFLSALASRGCCSPEAIALMKNLNMARELWTLLSASDMQLFAKTLTRESLQACRTIYPDGNLEVVLITDAGDIYCRLQSPANYPS